MKHKHHCCCSARSSSRVGTHQAACFNRKSIAVDSEPLMLWQWAVPCCSEASKRGDGRGCAWALSTNSPSCSTDLARQRVCNLSGANDVGVRGTEADCQCANDICFVVQSPIKKATNTLFATRDNVQAVCSRCCDDLGNQVQPNFNSRQQKATSRHEAV
jgi:hypothetical protein